MIEYRAVGGSATATEGVLNGLVTPFNSWTTIGDVKRGGFKERIAPGTFAKTLQERDVVLINSHDTAQPMARTSIKDGPGHLALLEDTDAGLRARAIPVQTSYARDVMLLAEAGVVAGMSFGFEVIKDDWTDAEGRAMTPSTGTHRTIREVRLFEVTTTAFPAYGDTNLTARDTINAARGVEERANPKPYGDVEYADPKNGKYPIDDEEHAKAAWAYINVPKNADEYPLNGVTLESVKDKIKAALHKFGVEISEDERTLWLWMTETRDEVDQDPEGAEMLRVQAEGAVCDLLKIDSKQLPPSIAAAIKAIAAYKQEIADHASATGGHGDVSEGARSAQTGAGETTPDVTPEEHRAYLRAFYGV